MATHMGRRVFRWTICLCTQWQWRRTVCKRQSSFLLCYCSTKSWNWY